MSGRNERGEVKRFNNIEGLLQDEPSLWDSSSIS